MAEVASRFNERSAGLTTVRNILEHLDAYEIGKGNLDKTSTEPGHVIDMLIEPDDVAFTARTASVRVLAVAQAARAALACTAAALNFHLRWRAIADLFEGFDFVETNPAAAESRIVQREAETPEQRHHRDTSASVKPESTIPDTPCPNCGLVM